MTTKLLVTVYITLTALLMSGCAGKVRYPNYYTLAVAPTQKTALNAPHTSATLAVRRFALLRIYARDGSSTGKPRKKSVSMTITAGLPTRALRLLP